MMSHSDNNGPRITDELSAVAAQLIEAACSARDGDRNATQAHIANAVALLRGSPISVLRRVPVLPHPTTYLARGGLPAWQTRKVHVYVEDNLFRPIQTPELARLVGLSTSYFCRAFKSTLGVSPREYVLRRRIEAAKSLMLTTCQPLSAISDQCGLCDQAHFTRAFHRLVGQTPSLWRRIRRGEMTSGVSAQP